ncbi:MAG: pseudouridine synthase [Allorhizobium sp.]
MTFKDKPRRSGAKPSDRDGKPFVRKTAKSTDKAPPKADKARPAPAVAAAEGMKPERISKIMARAGVASRRDIERMIMEGRVSLNGKVLDTPVVNATLADRIEVDGVAIRGIERTRLWLYHKPSGLVTTNSDPEGRPTVFDNLPEELPRVMSIGRLDINTEGLLLLTNDGGLARVLELPTTGWLRRYRVRAHGEIDQPALDKLKEGIAVEGVLYGSIEATLDRKQGHNVWITMGLREGKNREIKNVLGALGLEVNRLIRISYGPFQLGDLPEGKVVEVRGRMLRDQLGPRLIEDAKANFDAPIYSAAAADEENEAPVAAPEQSQWAKREKSEDKRERALGRLDTRRDGGDDRRKGAAKRETRGDDRREDFGDRPKRRAPGQSRTANVWMAPGARPVAEKTARNKDEAETAQKRAPRARPEGAPQTKRYGRTKDGLPTRSRGKFDPDRKGGKPSFDRPDAGPRVVVKRAEEDKDWIRADAPAKREEEGDRKRSFSDRPPRGDRPFGDKPRGARSFGAKPRGDRSFGDKPREDRRPRSEGDERPRARSFSGDQRSERAPRGDKPYGGKPREDRAFGDKPRAARTGDDRPSGGKPFGGKPKGGKSFGGKPSGSKPYSGRPQGDRPDGGGKGGAGKGKGMTRGADRRR